jgi:hypothetical protein
MPGIWMTRIARQLTRPDTFERLVSPAIADLQTEAAQGGLRRLRHYAALTMVLACAVLRDFRLDLSSAFDADSWRNVWGRAAAWALVAAACNWAAMYMLTARTLARLDGPPSLEAAVMDGLVFRSIVPALVAALVVAAYNLRRRHPSSLRTVVAVAAVFIVATPIVGAFASALFAPSRDALNQVYSIARPDLPAMTMAPQQLQALSGMIQTAAFAWLGVALARYRGWSLAFSATTILTLYVAGNLYLMQWLGRLIPGLTSIVYAASPIPLNAVTLAALILLMQAIQRPFDHRDLAVAR